MPNPRILRASALAAALLAATSGAALANPASDHISSAAANVGTRLGAAWANVSNADAQAAIAAARQRVLDRLATVGAAPTTTSTDQATDPLSAAQAGLTKAMNALNSNPTDADAGGLAGLTKAWNAVSAGLANAQTGAAHASSNRP
jgi:hypothetical protein